MKENKERNGKINNSNHTKWDYAVLCCIVLNYYTPLSPDDYSPGCPVKIEHKHTHTQHITQTNQLVNQSIRQSAVLMVGGATFPTTPGGEPLPFHFFDHQSSLQLLGHLRSHTYTSSWVCKTRTVNRWQCVQYSVVFTINVLYVDVSLCQVMCNCKSIYTLQYTMYNILYNCTHI